MYLSVVIVVVVKLCFYSVLTYFSEFLGYHKSKRNFSVRVKNGAPIKLWLILHWVQS